MHSCEMEQRNGDVGGHVHSDATSTHWPSQHVIAGQVAPHSESAATHLPSLGEPSPHLKGVELGHGHSLLLSAHDESRHRVGVDAGHVMVHSDVDAAQRTPSGQRVVPAGQGHSASVAAQDPSPQSTGNKLPQLCCGQSDAEAAHTDSKGAAQRTVLGSSHGHCVEDDAHEPSVHLDRPLGQLPHTWFAVMHEAVTGQ